MESIYKVTVVIPVYNVEKYISRCIESVLNQTLSEIEIIVVNDATKDGSMQIVKRYSNIKIIEHDTNKGLMWARRTGYMAAKGHYITFCDSDDYLPKDSLEVLYNEAVKTNADIVSGNLTYKKVDGSTEKWASLLNYGGDKKDVVKSLLKNEFRHNLCSKLFRKELLQDYKYQTFEHFINGEDGCLFYQLIRNANNVIQIDEQVYYYMQNTSSSSQVRYGEEGVKSICILNRIRHESSIIYPDLDDLRKKCITEILFDLYSQGYAFDANLNGSICEQNLSEYLELSLKNFKLLEICHFLIQRYIQGPIWYTKAKLSK